MRRYDVRFSSFAFMALFPLACSSGSTSALAPGADADAAGDASVSSDSGGDEESDSGSGADATGDSGSGDQADSGAADASRDTGTSTDAGRRTLRGAYANPDNPDGGGDPGGEVMVEALEAQVGPLDLELDYHPFTEPFPTANEQAALNHGRIPVVSLGCGDTNANIAGGKQDTVLKALADAMKVAGKPVVLRWFWEMNLADTANGRAPCFDPAYDGKGNQAPNFFDPAHYIAAWKHIHAVVAGEGATNVRMFFCPSGGSASTAAQYYPGDDYVELNGFDVYDRNGGTLEATLADAYGAAKTASANKPMWVGETGATAQDQQAGYIDGKTTAMLTANYPLIEGIIYFDSVGPAGNWSFTADGIAGFTAFGK